MLDADAISQIEGPAIVMGEIRWQNSWPKKANWRFQFFQPRFSSPNFPHPRIRDIVSSPNIFKNLNFQNCWWGKLGDKNHCRKNLNRQFDFFGCDFHHPTTHTLPPPPPITEPSLGDENRAEKIENGGLIFLAAIFSPLPIAIIAGPSNLRYWIFIEHYWEFTHRNIEFESPPIIRGEQKLRPKKLEMSASRLKKRLKCGRDKLPGQVDRHQAARPSRSTDLAERLTVCMRLYVHTQPKNRYHVFIFTTLLCYRSKKGSKWESVHLKLLPFLLPLYYHSANFICYLYTPIG